MKNLFKYVGLRHLKYRFMRTLLTSLGVALGVALFISIQVINHSTIASFKESIEAVAGKAQLIVTGGETGLPEENLKKVLKTDGVVHAVPMVEERAYLAGGRSAGEDPTLNILGVDLLKEQSVRTYKISDEQVIEDPLTFLNQPDSIILTHSFAEAHHLKIDSRFEIATTQGKKTLTVRGLLTPEGPGKAYGGSLGLMDIDGAQASFGKEGKVDRIDVVGKDGVNLDDLAKRLKDNLGSNFRIEKPEGQVQGMTQLVHSYQAMLNFFSTLALLVAVFLVLNSVSISVAERRREVGVLRALGATRAGILFLFVLEASGMGLVGSLLGVALGRNLASRMMTSVGQSMSTQYGVHIKAQVLVFGASEIMSGILVGVITAAIAAFYPAYRATQIQPLDAMKSAELNATFQRQKKISLLTWLGLSMVIFLQVASALRLSGKSHVIEIIIQVFGIVGPAFLAPGLVSLLIYIFKGPVSKLGGPVTHLAYDNLLQNLKRTGSNVTTLMVGLIMVILVATVNISFKKSIIDWFDRLSKSDFLVSSYGRIVEYQVQPLDEKIGREIEKTPGVLMGPERGAYGLRFIHIMYEGKQIGLKAWDRPNPNDHYSEFYIEDRKTEDAGHDLYESPNLTAVVSENFVMHFHKKTGDSVTLQSPAGPQVARIVGVTVDYADPEGVVYIDRAKFKKYWRDNLVEAFGIRAMPGYDKEKLRTEIENRFAKKYNLATISSGEMRKDIIKSVDEGFSYTQAIEGAALLVALLSLFNTFLISILERTRELGLLRAVGMSRGQMSILIIQEALVQGGFGAIIAAALGTFIAKLWIEGSLSYVLGWIIHFSFPWTSVLITILTGLTVTLLAGIYPAWRAAHIEIREALEYE